ASLFRFDLLDLKAAPSSARSIASPPTRDHIQFALVCRPVRMPTPLVISRAPSILSMPLGLPRRPISFAKLLGAKISATPSPMLNQPRPRAIFSSFGLFIPFRRPSPDQSNSDLAPRFSCLFVIFPLSQKFIPWASDHC